MKSRDNAWILLLSDSLSQNAEFMYPRCGDKIDLTFTETADGKSSLSASLGLNKAHLEWRHLLAW